MRAARFHALGIGLGMVLSANPSLAQGPSVTAQAQPAVPDSGDIIVTARRVEERLQDVPISITVFNQRELTNRNVVNAQDLANYTPSLSANSNYGSDNSSFAIRGFVQDPGTPPSVGVYFADVVSPRGSGLGGIPVGDGAGPGSFFDLQNVQVLKGPQGTLFGRNTTGGAILLIPQKPTSRSEGYLEASYGGYDMKRVQAALNLPFGDEFRLRLAVDHQDRDGYLKNDSGIGASRYGDVDYTAARVSAVVDLAPNLENYTIASYLRSDTAGPIQKVIACNPTPTQANFLGLLTCGQLARQLGSGFYTLQSDEPDPHSDLRQWQIINTTTWASSDRLTIKNIVSYAQLKQSLRSSLYGTDFKLGPLTLPFVDIAPAPGLPTAHQSTLTEEFRLQGEAGNSAVTYQGGVYFERSDPLGPVGNRSAVLSSCTNIAALQCIAPIPGGSAVNSVISRSSVQSIGAYAQASYHLSRRLTLTGGIRYTRDKQTNTSSRITYSFPTGVAVPVCTDATTTSLPQCAESLEKKSKAPTWLIDLDYKPGANLLLYAKYSRGYRSGGVFPAAPSNYRTFNPEKVDAYEIGTKVSFRGAINGNFNIAGFYNDFSNQQLLVPFNNAPGVPVSPTQGAVNAGRSRIYGVEVETTLHPFKGFSLNASYAYLHTQILQIASLVSTDPNYVVNFQIHPGQPLVLSPKNKLTVTGSYTFDLSPGLGSLTLGTTYTYTGRQLDSYAYNDPAMLAAYGGNLALLPARQLVNLNAEWANVAGVPVSLSIFVTNLTARKYYAFVPGVAAAGFETAVLGEPRMVGARLRYSFGR